MISIGYIGGTAVALIFVIAGVALIRRSRREINLDDGMLLVPPKAVRPAGILTVAITLAIWVATTWPSFDMQYHTWKPVTGTVETVATRLMAADHGSTQYYVVTLIGNPTAYRCDDSRCSLLKPGKPVRLMCIREWQYSGVPGWECNYDQTD